MEISSGICYTYPKHSAGRQGKGPGRCGKMAEQEAETMEQYIKPPVEVRYREELEALKANDTASRPENWQMSPRAVRTFILGSAKPVLYNGKEYTIEKKYFGNDALVERCIVTLAGNRGLDNIIGFTDYNNLQIDGHVSEVNGLEPLADKWAAFGWDVQSVDGHDVEEIDQAVSRAKQGGGKPHMIILRTVKGKGISFAENVVTNHSMTISKDVLERELKLLRGEGE